MSDFHPASKKCHTSISGIGLLPDHAGKAHIASPGALTFGSPNFKMLPDPIVYFAKYFSAGLTDCKYFNGYRVSDNKRTQVCNQCFNF